MSPNTGQSRVLAAAAQNGWITQRKTITSRVLRRGSVTVYVEFSVRGGVSYASTDRARIDGPGKADAVVAVLSEPNPLRRARRTATS